MQSEDDSSRDGAQRERRLFALLHALFESDAPPPAARCAAQHVRRERYATPAAAAIRHVLRAERQRHGRYAPAASQHTKLKKKYCC